jgi:Ca2+-binding RTX toxin-like protein
VAATGSCPDAPATLVGTSGDDRLTGTAGDDVIHGLGGDDVLEGLGGADIICGGVGTDVLRGGDGGDDLYGGPNGLQQLYEDNPPDNVGDTLVPGAGDDHVDPGRDTETDAGGGFIPDTISFRSAPGPVRVNLTLGTAVGDGNDTLFTEGTVEVIGSAHDDVLIGSEHADDLRGVEGHDVLHGLEGNDRLDTDPVAYRTTRPGWADRAYGGAGADTILLGNGNDLGRGASGRDNIIHGGGLTDIRAGAGNDYLDTYVRFGPGQHIDGGAGTDQLYLWSITDRAGNSVFARGRIDLGEGWISTRRGDRAHVGQLAGIEQLRAPHGVWDVIGTSREEWIAGPDTSRSRLMIRAGGGDDRISGTPGDDLLHGGDGTDRAVDDGGRDVCVSIERYYAGDRCEVNRE